MVGCELVLGLSPSLRPQYWAEKMPEIQDMAQANDKDQKLPRFVPLNPSDPTLKTMVKKCCLSSSQEGLQGKNRRLGQGQNCMARSHQEKSCLISL